MPTKLTFDEALERINDQHTITSDEVQARACESLLRSLADPLLVQP